MGIVTDRFRPISSTRSVSLVVGWRSTKGIEGGIVPLRDDAAEVMRRGVNFQLTDLAKRHARKFDYEGELEPNQFFVAKKDLLATESTVLSFLRSNVSRVQINARDLPKKSLLFYGVSIGSTAAKATIYFRKTNPYVLLKAGSVFSLEGEGLVPFTRPVFKIDGRVDAILYEDEIIIVNKRYFEQLFLDEDFVEEAMQRTVSAIVKNIGMSPKDAKALGEFAAEDPAVRRRLRAIHDRGVLQMCSISDIIAEINRQGLRKGDFVKNGKLYVSPGKELSLVKLLNEDHYIGGISKIHYDVDRKSVAP